MLYLLLCIAANVGIFSCFRAFKHYRIDTFQAIVCNYVVCVATGMIFSGTRRFGLVLEQGGAWIPYALGLGFIFIGTFYLMARTTQVFSMTVSSIATKMSLVIPVLFSLLILNIQSRDYSIFNYSGMVIALIAIIASSWKGDKEKVTHSHALDYLLPFAVFLLGGIIDSTINYVSYKFLQPEEEAVFPVFIFLSAAITGSIVLIIRRKRINVKSIAGGLILGIVNYFSVYYLVRALSAFRHDGALVYPLVNVGIILVSTVISAIVFREKFSRINLAGIVLAVAAIILLSHQELLPALFPGSGE